MSHGAGEIIVDEGSERADRTVLRHDQNHAPLFQHALLCQLGLPRRHVEERTFERRSGAASLLLEAGRWYTGMKWVQQPLPYGTRPRIVLINLCAEAVRTKSRTVNVAHSVRGFLKRLNIDAGGQSMQGFKRQMIALSCCHMQLGFRTQRGVGQIDSRPISRFEAWLTDEERQQGLWPGELELSAPFYDSLVEHAVPLDPGALSALQHSAMALDVYCWLAHRLCRVDQQAGLILPWRVLKEQFGQEYADVREFRRSFLDAIDKSRRVYADARLDVVRGGLRLLPSPAPIRKLMVSVAAPPRRPLRPSHDAPLKEEQGTAEAAPLPLMPETIKTVEILCKGWTAHQLWQRSPFANSRSSYKIDEGFKKWAWGFYTSAQQPTSSDTAMVGQDPLPLRRHTLEKARALANGHNVEWLALKFTQWVNGKGRAPRNPDAAFLAWIKSFLGSAAAEQV